LKKPVSPLANKFNALFGSKLKTHIDTGLAFLKKPNRSFKNYENMFNNLLRYQYVDTTHSIVDAEISKDSTRTITVTKANDREYYVKMFSLETLRLEF
jgi:hypothetical protein